MIGNFKKIIAFIFFYGACLCQGSASQQEETLPSETLALDVISYESFIQGDPKALHTLKVALYEKGIVGIRDVPLYQEKLSQFIEEARKFSALPEEIKMAYAPNHALGEIFLGYEQGKEKFKRPDGRWVVDNLKMSYYAFVPDSPLNKWPADGNLRASFEELGMVMSRVGEAVMEAVGLIGLDTDISLEGVPRTGRMLHYCKSMEGNSDNPFWCGAHFDHGMFTALTPAFYFINGEPVAEPEEAGLFVKTSRQSDFKKVAAHDPNILIFQVGEFGQLVTNDAIRATEHYVHKALGAVERYALALFFSPSVETVIHSKSELTQDARYGGKRGDPCSFGYWHEESFKRYIVKEENL